MAGLLDRSLGADVTLVTRFPRRPVTVLVDPAQLEMAILNLAVDARDAMPAGGTVIVDVRTEALESGNRYNLTLY